MLDYPIVSFHSSITLIQAADNPGKGVTVKSTDPLDITVNYTIPDHWPDGDVYDNYSPLLSVIK